MVERVNKAERDLKRKQALGLKYHLLVIQVRIGVVHLSCIFMRLYLFIDLKAWKVGSQLESLKLIDIQTSQEAQLFLGEVYTLKLWGSTYLDQLQSLFLAGGSATTVIYEIKTV